MDSSGPDIRFFTLKLWKLGGLGQLCRHCGGANGEPEGHIACISLDCPIFFERLKVQKELQSSSVVSSQTASYPPSFLDLF